VLVALAPPFERAAEATYTGHMFQHLVLLVVAAPLLAIGAPWSQTTRSHRWHRVAGRATRAALRDAAPIIAVAGFVGVLTVTHLTPIYELALRHRFVHDLEHAAFLGSAIGLWTGLRAGRRHHATQRIGAVFGVIAGTALVGVVLLTASSPLVPWYAERLGSNRALSDQRTAAAVMWVSGMAVTLPLLVTTVWRWASDEHRAVLRQEQLVESR
jgi:putative membrane protein